LKLRRTIILLAAVALLASACHRGPRRYRPVVDPELLRMTKEQVFQRGEEQYAKKNWQKARSYYTHVYETFPNEVLGRRSLLRIADTYFEQGDPVNLVEAQYKYRDFINRYPTSDQADYATLRIAMCSYKQMEKPDRDQQKTREALEKFNDMLRAYPKSALKTEAEARKQEVLDRLARHEHIIARFYMKRGSWLSATQRLNYIIDEYPNFVARDAVFYDLGQALAKLGRNGEAKLYFERVITEYPNSDYAQQAKRRLTDIKA
jgi:outer membrane protein assembly factor BamD